MEIEIQKWLLDAHKASQAIREFLQGKDYEDYSQDLMLSSAVERQFEILGEALKRIRDKDDRGWKGDTPLFL